MAGHRVRQGYAKEKSRSLGPSHSSVTTPSACFSEGCLPPGTPPFHRPSGHLACEMSFLSGCFGSKRTMPVEHTARPPIVRLK